MWDCIWLNETAYFEISEWDSNSGWTSVNQTKYCKQGNVKKLRFSVSLLTYAVPLFLGTIEIL